MDIYIEQIIENNHELLKDCKLTKINIGFTNSVYSANNKYIIKICNNKKNEQRFKNEINFYLKNQNNQYVPKLYNYHISCDEKDYSYEIIEKINGQSLYFIWHTFSEIKRKEIIKEISLIMKSFHSIKGKSYDWALFIKDKLLKDLNGCNLQNLFNKEEQDKINYVIENSSKYLNSDSFCLVHSDIHFDNIILDQDNNLKLIDFETAIYAPIDYELDIFLRMCMNPIKYANEETEHLINKEDYINIPTYLNEYYPEIFNIKYYEIRHAIYDLEAHFRLLARFTDNKELKENVLNIVNDLLLLI